MKLLIVLLLFATKYILVQSSDSEEKSHEPANFKIFNKTYTDFKQFTKDCSFRKIRKSGYFSRSLPSVLIIHGIETNYYSEMSKTLIEAFLSRKEHNVIFGDWSAYAFDDYSEVTQEIDHIANAFVDLLNLMMDDYYELTKIYIVGHDLGAHIAGRIGNLLQHQNITLPRITGLDPAGPLYDLQVIRKTFFGASGSDHIPLSKDAAKFVDIIHTNAGFYRGMLTSQGHLDFWPNCGVFQPNCDTCSFPKIFFDYKNCSMCSHIASWRYYAESVRSKIPTFEARRCTSKFLMKFFCLGESAFMGYYASENAASGDYYVETNANSPYTK